ncbi:MAG: ABC transporter substrate-binding protein [Proteobacteria bacterium]|nr:ABC transporter substrate-binding protein [Pseudomonadota bacterium]MBI3498058.1 ABC transporter substrate-binding protein [Pseudomonadota bacterium]
MVRACMSLLFGLAVLFLVPALALAQAPQRGGTLASIVNPEPPILIVGLNNQGPTLMVGGKIYQGLLRFDHDLKPLPSLAKSWTISADGRTYTFKLEETVRWHDGKPFSAEDVVFSLTKWHTELNPRSRAVLQRMAAVTAPDRSTVVIQLKEPFEPLLLMFDATALAIMPKHIYDGTDFRTNPMNQTPIGTGPFKFKEWQRGQYIQLVRNEDYWKPGLPYLDAIIYRVIPDAAQRAVALETGVVQLAQSNDIEPFEMPRFRALRNFEITGKGWEMFSPLAWMDLNLREPPLNDKRFRQALISAIDRNFIRERIWHALGRVPTGPIASTTRFYDKDVPLYPHDPERAKKLLDDMGLKPDSRGVRAHLKNLALPYGEVWMRTAEYVKQALAKVGIEVTIESTDAGAWAQRLGEWQYQTSFNFVYQWGDPTLGVARTYVSSNIQKIAFTNTMGYANPTVDDLFARAATAPTASDRQKLFSQVQRILAEDVPVVWLLELEFPTIHDKRLKHVVSEGVGTNASFEDVYFAK